MKGSVYIPSLSSRLKAYKNCILGYEKQSYIAIIIVLKKCFITVCSTQA